MDRDRKPQGDAHDVGETPEDVEGHSLSLVMGVNAMERASRAEHARDKASDETLTPLTRPFPRLKDDRRR